MSWQGMQGQDEVVELFRRALARGRLASTFLFVGPQGVGKHLFAVKLAQALLCQRSPAERVDPCGQCPSCQQVMAGTHPDLIQIAKPKDKSEIPVALLIGPQERRMQEGLCHDISLKPFMGGRRIAIIDDADHLNEEGANCLLKTLEEPPPRSVLILIGTTPEQQLPTIRSRAQLIRFAPLSVEILKRLMLSEGIVASAEEAQRLAPFCEGSLARARELADPELWAFRKQLLAALAQTRPESLRLAKAVTAFVEDAGKEAAARRSRSRQIIRFAAEFYRQLARTIASAGQSSDADLQSAVDTAARAGKVDVETAAALGSRCLDALGHVDRNANQTAMLECWVHDLAQIASGRPLPVG